MADSVDRVFSHALNTVTKIRAGSEKPPSHIRLSLYGLYKQSMEGDISGILNRPFGDNEEIYRAQEKWDAWKQHEGLSRTEAKRQYINKLIETMHQYASRSPDARELVAELDFVWDQVKFNVSSNVSSHPLAVSANNLGRSNMSLALQGYGNREQRIDGRKKAASVMRTLGPLSAEDDKGQEDETAKEEDDDNDNETDDDDDINDDVENAGRGTEVGDFRHNRVSEQHMDKIWQRTLEQAIIRMTTEVTALREQLESRRRFFGYNPPKRFFRLILGLFWGTIKHVAIDFILLTLILLWLRRRRIGRKEMAGFIAEDSRIEAAVRVLIGDTVAQMRNASGAKVSHVGHVLTSNNE